MPFGRKSTRLPPTTYLGQKIYFITVCCDGRSCYLANDATARMVLAILYEETANLGFLLHAYCLMPDHVHLLVHGLGVDANLLRLIKQFKSRAAFLFRRDFGKRLWEMSYYEHILRKAEEVEPVACYIWNNPVRKGLCARPEEFAFSGSQTINWVISVQRGQGFVPPWKAKWPV